MAVGHPAILLLGAHQCEYPALLHETMLMSVVLAASKDLVWLGVWSYCNGDHVPGLCSLQKPSGSPSSMFPLTGKSEESSLALISITSDAQLHRWFLWRPLCQPSPLAKECNSLNRKISKRTLKNVWYGYYSVALHNWWLPKRVQEGNDSVLFKEQVNESLTTLQWIHR